MKKILFNSYKEEKTLIMEIDVYAKFIINLGI